MAKLLSSKFKPCGPMISKKTPFFPEDYLTNKFLEDSIKIVNGSFQVHLPWRLGVIRLPTERRVALNRPILLKRRFTKNPFIKEGYVNTIDEYLPKVFLQTNAKMYFCGTCPTNKSHISTNHLRSV